MNGKGLLPEILADDLGFTDTQPYGSEIPTPNTYEWLARLWNLRIDKCPPEQAWTWPEADYLGPSLARIARDYLPYLHQNALANQDGKKTFDYQAATLEIRNTVTTTYRVWPTASDCPWPTASDCPWPQSIKSF